MKTCQKCGTTYDDAVSFCSRDGEVLQDDHAEMIGRVLDNQYEIEAFIAEGGMGAVYRARHTLLGDRVAIKILPPEMRRNSEWLKRFQREGQAARRFRHPNSVIVHDLRTSSEGWNYLVMEYVEGRTLDEEMSARGGRLAPAESVKIIETVASVLDAAHAQGVVHRDLKPSNIMLTSEGGTVKLLDLGIAKISDAQAGSTALTTAGQLLGTPYYMSPEQWGEIPRDGGIEIDGRADIYSLGVVVYQVTTGELPFKADTAVELRRAHCRQSPRPLEQFDASIPALWSRAVLRAMAKDRSERPPSAGEFARELREALSRPQMMPQSSRVDAPTVAGTLNETVRAGRGATPQNLAAVTVNESGSAWMAEGSAAAATPPAAAAAKRSWTLGLMSSRGCQVSLTVAAMALLAVMVGSYALMQRFAGSSDRSLTANANRSNAPTTTGGGPQPDTTTTTANSNESATGRELLRYHLLLSESALDDQTRVLGDEPLKAGQSLQFSFETSADGFLYMLGHDEQGSPVVMPLGTLVAAAPVRAGQETEVPVLARIKLNSEPSTEVFTVIFSEDALDLPFAGESLPIDGTFRKLTVDEQRKIKELRQQGARASVRFNGGQDDGDAIVTLSDERKARPVVFDIRLRLIKH
ncbi:MAG: protein kinase [Acidobacteria bacterium]|nr:protein kinase [Acidobacteriota bacterium]